MMKKKEPRMALRSWGVWLAALMVIQAPVGAVEVTPLFDFQFLGGQHFFDGDVSSISGNANVLWSPALRFNDKWSVIPTYSGGFRGTRDVEELAGGGTLFKESTSHNLSVKGIYSLTSVWKLKATGGAGVELLRETNDETLGGGLFDYQKYTGGLETEYAFSRQVGARFAYDFYLLTFPHYESLESSQDSTLSRELSGEKVLDSNNHLFTLGSWFPVPGEVQGEVTAYFNSRDFGDQPIVAASGDLTSSDRSDTLWAVGTNFSYPFALGKGLRFVGELGGTFSQNTSNQNHYDARKTVFLKDFYDYSQYSVSPRVTAALGGKPWIASVGATYQKREYDERPIQDQDGDYLSAKTEVEEISAEVGLSYPLTKNFKARAVGSLGWSDSNMKYEKVFRYNYKIANYLFGFSYEY